MKIPQKLQAFLSGGYQPSFYKMAATAAVNPWVKQLVDAVEGVASATGDRKAALGDALGIHIKNDLTPHVADRLEALLNNPDTATLARAMASSGKVRDALTRTLGIKHWNSDDIAELTAARRAEVLERLVSRAASANQHPLPKPPPPPGSGGLGGPSGPMPPPVPGGAPTVGSTHPGFSPPTHPGFSPPPQTAPNAHTVGGGTTTSTTPVGATPPTPTPGASGVGGGAPTGGARPATAATPVAPDIGDFQTIRPGNAVTRFLRDKVGLPKWMVGGTAIGAAGLLGAASVPVIDGALTQQASPTPTIPGLRDKARSAAQGAMQPSAPGAAAGAAGAAGTPAAPNQFMQHMGQYGGYYAGGASVAALLAYLLSRKRER